MATRLKNILRFAGLAVGVPVPLPHNLNLDGVSVIPDKVDPAAGGFTVIADATNITVTRNVGDVDNVDVFAEYWNTDDRVFGSDGTPFTQLAPAPFIGSPGTGSSQAQSLVLFDGSTVNVFIDSINGLDTNDGLTAATAIQTLTEVYTKFPIRAVQRSQIIVNFAGVGGFGANATAIADYDTTSLLVGGDGSAFGATYHYRGPQMVPIIPATGPATAAFDGTPVVAVIGGSANAGGTRAARFDFSGATPGWTINDFRGKFLRITRAGVLVIFEIPIASNTADTITVLKNGLAATTDAILSTDVAEIVEPGARFINTTLVGLDFDSCRISGTATQDADVIDGAPNPQAGLTFARVQFRTAPTIQAAFEVEFDRCSLGSFAVFAMDSSIYFVNCSMSALTLWNSVACGTFAAPNPDSATSPIVANRGFFMDLQTEFLSIGESNAPASWYATKGIGIAGTPATVDCIFVGPQSYLQCSGEGDIQGGGLAGSLAGLRCSQGGYAEVLSNSTAGRTSVAGAGGDLKVGSPAAAFLDYGTGVGDFEEANGFNGNFQRFPIVVGAQSDSSIISTISLF